MKSRRLGVLLTVALGLASTGVWAEHHETGSTLDEIVAKHIEAKGGRDAWSALESLELTGEFTAFSKTSPFTQRKTSDRRFFMDHIWGDQPVVIGFDGETAWWNNGFFGEGARFIDGPDRAVLERELDFATPLFDLESAGHTATLLGRQEVDGIPVIAIELQRSDESKETWYLDPETYLEVARDSPASDFGRPMTQRTFFDDFREVEGVMIPHYTETQWYTRHRVVAVDAVRANVAWEDDAFSMPPPLGMEKLQSLAGTWDVARQTRQNPSAEFTESQGQSTIESHFRGAMFEESWTSPSGIQAIRTLSYDKYRDRYLATLIDSNSSVMDILAGGWNDDGALVLDDHVTQTPSLVFGMTIFERMKLFAIEPDSFKIERENSVDDGETWAVMQKLTYTRRVPADPADEAEE